MGGRGGARASWEGKAEGWRVRGRAMNPSVNEWFMVGRLKAGKDGGRKTEDGRQKTVCSIMREFLIIN